MMPTITWSEGRSRFQTQPCNIPSVKPSTRPSKGPSADNCKLIDHVCKTEAPFSFLKYNESRARSPLLIILVILT